MTFRCTRCGTTYPHDLGFGHWRDHVTLDAAMQALYEALGIKDQYVAKDTYTQQLRRATLTAHEQHQSLIACQSRLTTLLEARNERESSP